MNNAKLQVLEQAQAAVLCKINGFFLKWFPINQSINYSIISELVGILSKDRCSKNLSVSFDICTRNVASFPWKSIFFDDFRVNSIINQSINQPATIKLLVFLWNIIDFGLVIVYMSKVVDISTLKVIRAWWWWNLSFLAYTLILLAYENRAIKKSWKPGALT